MVLALLLPVTLGLACTKRNWDFCSPSAPCKTGYICTDDWRCMLPDGGSDGLVVVDSHGATDLAGGGLDGPASAGTDGLGGAGPGPDAVDSPGSALPDAAPSTPGIDAGGGAGGNGGGPDAAASAPAIDAAGGNGGGLDVAPDVLVVTPDAPLPRAVGAACSVGSDCAGGSCADGVCCDKPALAAMPASRPSAARLMAPAAL